MDADKAVITLISRDDNYEASQPNTKKIKDMAPPPRSAPSGGLHAATRVEESKVLSDITFIGPHAKRIPIIGSLRTRRTLLKRQKKRKAKKRINCAPQGEISGGKQVDAGKSIKMLKLDGTKSAGESKNIVLQKLLRGPRYFDPLETKREMCWLCGEEGHNTFKCTAEKRKRPCYVCAGFGHDGRSCKQSQECFNCNRLGHYAKLCPNKNEENYHTFNVCLRCGDSEHDMWMCDSDYSYDDLKEIQCHVCKNFGHLCCVDYPDLGPRKISCCNCGQSGHVGSDCAEVNVKPNGPISCHKFGKKGLSALKCKKHAKGKNAQRIFKEERDSLGSAPHDLNKAHGKIRTPHEERDSLGSKSAPHYLNKAHGKIRTPHEERDSLGSKSAPHDLNKAHGKSMTPHDKIANTTALQSRWRNEGLNKAQGKIKTPHEERASTTVFQPRWRTEWSMDGRTLCFREPGSNVRRGPPTYAKNNEDVSAASSSGNFWSPGNLFQMFNHPGTPGSQALSTRGYFSSPQNPIQMFNHFATPGSQAYQPARNNDNHFIPQNPFYMFNSPPFPGSSQAYLPAINNQEISALPASRKFSIPHPVQMFNDQVTPSSQAYRARFFPPWSGNF